MRPTAEVANAKKAAVRKMAYAGKIPKEIAPEVGLSEARVRAILWVDGWQNIWTSPEEQALILKNRSAA